MTVLKIQIKRSITLNVIKIALTNLFVLGFQPTNEHSVVLHHPFCNKEKGLERPSKQA